MMFLQQSLLACVAIAGFAASQDLSNVDVATKEHWCMMQRDSCGLICLQFDEGDPSHNSCDSETLDYSCVCDGGKSPNASEYSQTIPYFLCTERNNQCVRDCPPDTNQRSCQSDCREDNPCGAQNPTRVSLTASLSTPDPTASESSTKTDAIYDGFGEDSATDDDDDDGSGAGRLALEIGQVYGMGIMVAGFIGGFALLL